MAFYSGSLNVLEDGQGQVIPITLLPKDVPADGLTIDVSSLAPPNGSFGYIAGLTVDATSANVAAGLISIYFAGGSNLTRNANGGNTQVYKASGPCQQVTIKNLAWTTGQVILVLWNSPPANELQSPLTVVASGTVAISGTPTVQFAAGQTVNVNAGNITFTNSQIDIAHESTSITQLAQTINSIGNGGSVQMVPIAQAGTIRSIDISAVALQAFGIAGYVDVRVQSGGTLYRGILPASPDYVPHVDVISLTTLGIGFGLGISFVLIYSNINISFSSDSFITCVIGWTP